jgi:hypothetical protein
MKKPSSVCTRVLTRVLDLMLGKVPIKWIGPFNIGLTSLVRSTRA